MAVTAARLSDWMQDIEANLHGHIAWLHRRHPSMLIWDEPAFLLVDSGLASDTFNKIARARLSAASCTQEIHRATGHFQKQQRPFTWWVGPGSRPLDLEDRLRDLGLREAARETGMGLELRTLRPPPRPAEAHIRRVLSPGQLEDAAGVLCGLPEGSDPVVAVFYRAAAPWILQSHTMRLFVAYVDGQPAAVSSLYMDGEVGGIYNVATAGAFRRRGLGSYMTWVAAHDARCAGATRAVLQAAEAGRGIYRRLGFREHCELAEYTPQTRPQEDAHAQGCDSR